MDKGKRINRTSGFSLIEVIVTLVLVGILAAFGGTMIVTGVRGYILAKESAALVQKAQLAMTRISRELMDMTNVTNTTVAPNPTSISYTDPRANSTSTIGLVSGGTIRIAPAPVNLDNGNILVENVTSFTLTYLDLDGNTWTTANRMDRLYRIVISITMTSRDGSVGAQTFTTTINPRNNGTLNGPA